MFTPKRLTLLSPDGTFEQWHCHVTRDKVTFSNGATRFDFLGRVCTFNEEVVNVYAGDHLILRC